MSVGRLSRLSSSCGFGAGAPAHNTLRFGNPGTGTKSLRQRNAADEDVAQAFALRQREQLLLARRAQVGIDEQRTFADLRK
jgi:hypothetical protein